MEKDIDLEKFLHNTFGKDVKILQNINGKLIAKCNNKILKISKNPILKKEYKILKILENINFKYSPKVYDFIDKDDVLCIVEEFIEGQTLDKAIIETNNPEIIYKGIKKILNIIHSLNIESYIEKPLKENIINELEEVMIKNKSITIEEIKLAKKFLNEDKIVFIHGDFKPRNIIVGNYGNIKAIVDWEFSEYNLKSEEASVCAFSQIPFQECFSNVVTNECFLTQNIWFVRSLLYKIIYDNTKIDEHLQMMRNLYNLKKK